MQKYKKSLRNGGSFYGNGVGKPLLFTENEVQYIGEPVTALEQLFFG